MNKNLEEQIAELAAPIQEAIKAEFDKKMAEAKEMAYEQARIELSEKYKVDFDNLVNATEMMIKESIEEKCADLVKAENQKMKAYKKVNEALALQEKRINESLEKELNAIRDEKSSINVKLKELSEGIEARLQDEVTRLQEEKQKYISLSAKVIEEGIEIQENARSNFVKTATELCANAIEEHLNESIDSLKDEIKEAQKNEFGKRLFEMFSGEFKALFLDENKEIQKERAEKEAINESLTKAKKILANKEEQINSLKAKINEEQSLRKREAIISEATVGLSEPKRKVLQKMVESVATEDLAKTIADYIPVVLNSNSKKFKESVEPVKSAPKLTIKTGDKKVISESAKEKVQEETERNLLNEEIQGIDLDVEYMDRLLGL